MPTDFEWGVTNGLLSKAVVGVQGVHLMVGALGLAGTVWQTVGCAGSDAATSSLCAAACEVPRAP